MVFEWQTYRLYWRFYFNTFRNESLYTGVTKTKTYENEDLRSRLGLSFRSTKTKTWGLGFRSTKTKTLR